MINQPCAAPLTLPALLEYWFDELAPNREQPIEEHLMACGHCASRLQEITNLASEIHASFQRGEIASVISLAFVEKMKGQGLRLREYRVPCGGSVQCTISASDDAVVARLQAPLEDVKRLDLLLLNERGEPPVKLLDIPFDPTVGEILFCPSAAALKKMPAHTDRIRLVAVDELGERTLGDYTFIHTPG